MNKGILLITGPTESGKTWLANCIQTTYGEMGVVIWDEPILEGAGSCSLAIRKFAKVGLAIIASTEILTKGNGGLKFNQVIRLSDYE